MTGMRFAAFANSMGFLCFPAFAGEPGKDHPQRILY